MAHGVPFRVDRITRLGNAITPPIAEAIGKAIIRWEQR
jgi:site-specific DNA-cytosine methylase